MPPASGADTRQQSPPLPRADCPENAADKTRSAFAAHPLSCPILQVSARCLLPAVRCSLPTGETPARPCSPLPAQTAQSQVLPAPAQTIAAARLISTQVPPQRWACCAAQSSPRRDQDTPRLSRPANPVGGWNDKNP